MTVQVTPSSSQAALIGDKTDGGQLNTESRTELISFAIGDEQYGVDIMAVREIKEWSKVTRLPDQPDYLRGVLNLRGVIVPIIDLRCRFGLGVTESTPMHIIIIVQIDGRQIGLLADRVLDIVSCEASKVQKVPTVHVGTRDEFLAGLITIEGAMIALIDLPNLLSVSSVADDGAPPVAAQPSAPQAH